MDLVECVALGCQVDCMGSADDLVAHGGRWAAQKGVDGEREKEESRQKRWKSRSPEKKIQFSLGSPLSSDCSRPCVSRRVNNIDL